MKSFIQSVLVIAVIVGSWVGAYRLVLKKQMDEKASQTQKMREQLCVMDELKTFSREATAARYEGILNPALENLNAKIPTTPDVSELIDELTQLGKKSKVVLVSYETGEHEKSVIAEVRVTGRLKQVFEFIANLSTFKRLVTIERLSYENRMAEITLNAPWGELEMSGVLAKHTPYRCGEFSTVNLQAIGIPWLSNLAQKIPAIKRSPFVEQLSHITARGLHLVGLIQQRSAWLGLVEDEHGFGQVVRVGDRLPNGFKVEAISNKGLSLVSGSTHQSMGWRKP